MTAKFIVMLSDEGDDKRGEITVSDNPRTAEHLVETLLEAGYPQERIHLFSGELTPMQVDVRPVVSLMDDAVNPPRAAPAEPAAAGPALAEEPAAAEQRVAIGVATSPESRWSDNEEEENEVPYERDGVRFSSLFRTG